MAWYIYTGSTWKKVKNAYRKTTPASYYGTDPANFTDASKEWRRTSAMYTKTSTGWRRVFTKTSTGVKFTTGPAIHVYSSPYPYGPNDGLSVSSPRYINDVLYGKDGIWTPRNEISVTRSFQAALAPDGSYRFTIDNNDVFDLSTSPDNQDWADETYLYYKINVKNYGDTVTASAGPIKLIKREPSFNSQNLTGTATVGSTLSGTYSLENKWYNKPELYNSFIRWWRSSTTDPSGTLVREEYLGDHVSTNNSTSLQGSDTYTIQAADAGYYIVFQVVPYNSWNRHYGYPTYMSYPSNIISAPTTISNVNFTDTYGRSGKNARGNLVTNTTTYLNWTVGGVNSSTTFRVRYRIYNNQNGLYYKPNDPSTSVAAGSAWISYSTNYSGTGDITSISINGSTATLSDYFTIDPTFNGSTYGGGLARWSFQYEISVVNSSGTRYYWNYGDSISTTQANDYWDIDPTTNPSISASSSNVPVGGSVTFSGTFNSYPASLSSYPHSYRIVYGDGSDSGWISLSAGTANQTYSQSHTYNYAGSYSAYVETTPWYTTNYAYVTAANPITTPTGLYGYANGSGATQSITLNWNATSDANTYELFFNSNPTPPTDYSTYADYRGITTNTYTTPVIFSASSTYYWYVRGKGSSGTFSTWSPVASVTTNAQVVKLSTPTGVTASSNRTDGVLISWNAVSGASYYGIWYGGAPGYDYLADFGGNRNSSLITGTSYLDTSIGQGSTRDYYVQAYKSGDPSGTKSDWSSVATGTRLVPVANLTAPYVYDVVKSGSTYYVYFTGGSGPAYQVWWQGSSGTPSTCGPGDAQGTSNPIPVTNLPNSPGSTYYFFVRSTSSTSTTTCGPSSSASEWSGAYSYTQPSGTTITYGSCFEDYRTTDYNYCSGNARITGGTIYYKRQVLVNGSWNGTYDTSGCSSSSWSNYDPYGCYSAPTCQLYSCLQYDVSDPASPNYVGHCYTLGACDAPYNNDGRGRSCCQY